MTDQTHRQAAAALIERAEEFAAVVQAHIGQAEPGDLMPVAALASLATANALLAIEGQLAELVRLQRKIATVYGVGEAARS